MVFCYCYRAMRVVVPGKGEACMSKNVVGDYCREDRVHCRPYCTEGLVFGRHYILGIFCLSHPINVCSCCQLKRQDNHIKQCTAQTRCRQQQQQSTNPLQPPPTPPDPAVAGEDSAGETETTSFTAHDENSFSAGPPARSIHVHTDCLGKGGGGAQHWQTAAGCRGVVHFSASSVHTLPPAHAALIGHGMRRTQRPKASALRTRPPCGPRPMGSQLCSREAEGLF